MTTVHSNFGKRCSDAHFVPSLFYYCCIYGKMANHKIIKDIKACLLVKDLAFEPKLPKCKRAKFYKKVNNKKCYIFNYDFYCHQQKIVYFSSLANLCPFWANILDLNHVQKSLFLINNTTFYVISIRYLSRFFDCLMHPNLSATLATDQKWPLSHLRISYQSLAEFH